MDKEITVMKVGGSCLTSADALRKLMNIVNAYKNTSQMVFVASAFSGVTDRLIELAALASEKKEAYKEKVTALRKSHEDIVTALFKDNIIYLENASDFLNKSMHDLEEILEQVFDYGMETFRNDYVIAFGEKLSTFILGEYLTSQGIETTYVPGDQLVVTDNKFGNALPLMDFTVRKFKRQILPLLARNVVPVITGFIGVNKQGFTTTLGRGGSDYSASIVAYALADLLPDKKVKVILWKNVDGILSAAPEFVDRPRLLERITFGEAKEISHFGAKVLHPKCVSPLERKKIPLEIRNFDKPLDARFTRIDATGDDSIILKGFSILKDVSLVTAKSGSLVAVPGVLAKIFTILGESGISVSLVSQSSSEINTTFCTAEAEGKKAVDLLKNAPGFKEWFEFGYDEKVVVLGVIGMVNKPGVKNRIFQTLDEINIDVLAVAQSTDSLNISIVIKQDRASEAIRAIHACFESCFA